mgnify:CR=1 FL=1
MRKYLRQVMPGQQFTLLRTGEKYRLIRRVFKTPTGTFLVVVRDDPCIKSNGNQPFESLLHHGCHVWVTEGNQSCQ